MSRGAARSARHWCFWEYLALALALRLAEAAARNSGAHRASRHKAAVQKASRNRQREYSAEAVLNKVHRQHGKVRRRKVIAEVPFYSAKVSLQDYMKGRGAKHEVAFQFREPRHLMMIYHAERGTPIYGYTDEYPPRPGGNGTIILLHERYAKTGKVIHWHGSKQEGPVMVWGQPGPKFRILSVSTKPLPGFEQWATPEKVGEAHRRQREEPGASLRELPLFQGKVMIWPDSDPRRTPHYRRTQEQKEAHNKKIELWDALMHMRVVTEEDDPEGYLGPPDVPVVKEKTQKMINRERRAAAMLGKQKVHEL